MLLSKILTHNIVFLKKHRFLNKEVLRNTEVNFCDLELGNDFLAMTTKAQITTKKINRLHQIKKLCVSKDTIKKMKGQPIEWKKIFLNYISDNGFITRIHKERLTIKQ